jgi:predicted amidohydrolase
MSNKITIALLQHAAPPSEPRDSYLKRGEKMVRRAQSQGSRIIFTQEFFENSHCCHADVYGSVTQLFLDGAK